MQVKFASQILYSTYSITEVNEYNTNFEKHDYNRFIIYMMFFIDYMNDEDLRVGVVVKDESAKNNFYFMRGVVRKNLRDKNIRNLVIGMPIVVYEGFSDLNIYQNINYIFVDTSNDLMSKNDDNINRKKIREENINLIIPKNLTLPF